MIGAKKLVLVTCLALSVVLAARSQTIHDFTGQWSGTGNWGLQNYLITLTLHLEGQLLTGELFAETPNKKKFARYTIEGPVVNGVATLKGLQYIDKKGLWCIPGYVFTLNPEKTSLTGKWKANTGVASGCVLAGIGNINLTRQLPEGPIVARNRQQTIPATTPVVAIANDDRMGNALELSCRREIIMP